MTTSVAIASVRGNGAKHLRNKLLAELNLTRNASWEEAEEQIKHVLVCARRLRRDPLAAQWSEYEQFLKKRLKHRCADCPTLVFPKSTRCPACASKIPRPKRDYQTYANTESGISRLVEQFVRAATAPFFLDEVCYWVHLQKREVPHQYVHRKSYDTLAKMKKHGLVSGGGVINWRRYEKVDTK